MYCNNQIIIARCEDFPTWDDVEKLRLSLGCVRDDEKAYEHGYWRTLEDWEYDNLKYIYAQNIEDCQLSEKSEKPRQNNSDIKNDHEKNLREFFEKKSYRYNGKGQICEKLSGISFWAELQENDDYTGDDKDDDECLEKYKYKYKDVFKIYDREDIYALVLPNGCPITGVTRLNALIDNGFLERDTMVYVIES